MTESNQKVGIRTYFEKVFKKRKKNKNAFKFL